jgi:hypothetical protein
LQKRRSKAFIFLLLEASKDLPHHRPLPIPIEADPAEKDSCWSAHILLPLLLMTQKTAALPLCPHSNLSSCFNFDSSYNTHFFSNTIRRIIDIAWIIYQPYNNRSGQQTAFWFSVATCCQLTVSECLLIRTENNVGV